MMVRYGRVMITPRTGNMAFSRRNYELVANRLFAIEDMSPHLVHRCSKLVSDYLESL